jgi:predicted glycogen debranching enzyme
VTRIVLERGDAHDFASLARREWLVTNGLGGFAAGTVTGACTRRYHGLLIAALRPPLGRTLLVASLQLRVGYHGRWHALSANEYADGTIDPQGWRHLERFELDGPVPCWSYTAGDALIEQRIWMAHGRNTTYVGLRVERGSDPVEIEATPLCTYRDYHAHGRGGWSLDVDARADGCRIQAFAGARPYAIACDRGRFEAAPAWYWNFRHREESARGLDDVEDLFRPGAFRARISPGESVNFVFTADGDPVGAAAATLDAVYGRAARLESGAGGRQPGWIRRLALAADQFIVRRDAGGEGTTMIAGYPWFGDWGRDTMIALPGLTLATGRFDDAARILRTFAVHVSEGMLPNRFPDAGEEPEYNTVDATLWYFHAIEAYGRASGDGALAAELYPVLADILEWHLRGTRYGIGVDPADGLLRAGEPGVQLTWMDAKIGDWVVTPRIGKPVEINALWYNALEFMAELAQAQGQAGAAKRCAGLAGRVRESFAARFWYREGGYLYDVVDGPADSPDPAARGDDRRLRPNQIFAVSLPRPLLEGPRARAVVDACARELWTPCGLRSLAPGDPAYAPAYRGGPAERDAVYHQGTVWSWLLGPFATAHYRVYGDAAAARAWLAPAAGHLRDACLGSISEIFDAEPPHAPRGCFAQAWSVAEVLRAWSDLTAADRIEQVDPAEVKSA